jgi:hypothetical protein
MQTINGVYPSNIRKFSLHNRAMAMEFKFKRTPEGYRFGIFHGEGSQFWVVSGGRNIKKLKEAGYEEITH